MQADRSYREHLLTIQEPETLPHCLDRRCHVVCATLNLVTVRRLNAASVGASESSLHLLQLKRLVSGARGRSDCGSVDHADFKP